MVSPVLRVCRVFRVLRVPRVLRAVGFLGFGVLGQGFKTRVPNGILGFGFRGSLGFRGAGV